MKKNEREHSKELRTKLNECITLNDYKGCTLLKPTQETILGTGFFPVGDGLYREDGLNPEFPFNGIMIVGQDYGTLEYVYNEGKKINSELEIKTGKTWPNVIKIYFNDFNMPKDKCFFTNALMGLRIDPKMTGPMISKIKSSNPLLLDKNRQFFIKQIEKQKPKIIIFLGNELIQFCKSDLISSNLNSLISEQKINRTSQINDFHTFNDFKNTGHSIDVIFLRHPSSHSRAPKYETSRKDIERKMINKALERNKFI